MQYGASNLDLFISHVEAKPEWIGLPYVMNANGAVHQQIMGLLGKELYLFLS